MVRRERTISLEKQKNVASIKPEVRRFNSLAVKMKGVKRLEKVRKVIAYNTMKAWQKRISDKSK